MVAAFDGGHDHADNPEDNKRCGDADQDFAPRLRGSPLMTDLAVRVDSQKFAMLAAERRDE
jgi:hypothetical protein